MSDMIGEKLSSLVDGELAGSEYEHTVNAIKQDDELRRRWERYHIATDSLKNNLPSTISKSNLADRVMSALESEPTVFAPRSVTHKVNPLVKQIAGLAVAASVTAIAVFSAQSWKSNSDTAPLPVVQTQPAAPVQATAVASTTTQVPENLQSRLNAYLLNHNQNSLAVHGMLPYARIVGYSAGENAE